MRRLVSVLCLLTMLVGCASTPKRQWSQAAEVLNAARDSAVTLSQAGIVDKDEFNKIYAVEQTARSALEVARTQIDAGGTEFDRWIAVVNAGIIELARIEAERIDKAGSP